MKASQNTIENLNVVLAKLNTVVDNMQSGKGSFGQLLTNPELYNKFTAAADEVHKLSVKMNSNDNTVGKFFNDNAEMYNRMNDAIGRVDDITNLQSGKGSAGKMLTDETMYNNLNQSLASLNAILADAEAGKGSAGMLLGPDVCQDAERCRDQDGRVGDGDQRGQGDAGQAGDRRCGVYQPEQAADREHDAGDDHPATEEVSDDPYEDLLGADER